jgi:hypothetical protein
VSLPIGASTEPLHVRVVVLQVISVVVFPGLTVTDADWVEVETYAGLRACADVVSGMEI